MKKILVSMSYSLNFVRIICTILAILYGFDTMYFSILSIFVLLASIIDQTLVAVKLICLLIILLMWIAIILLSFVCIKYRKFLSNLFILSIIAALFDCVLTMIFSTLGAKICGMVIFVLALTVNVGAIVLIRKER